MKRKPFQKNESKNTWKDPALLDDAEAIIIETLGREAGIPWVWVCGGALATILVLIVCLFGIIVSQGLYALWPKELQTISGSQLSGIAMRTIESTDESAKNVENVIFYLANRDFGTEEFTYVPPQELTKNEMTESLWFVERMEWGPFIGNIRSLIRMENDDKQVVETSKEEIFSAIEAAKTRAEQIRAMERKHIRPINEELEDLRIELRSYERRALSGEKDFSAEILFIEQQNKMLTEQYEVWATKMREAIEADSRHLVLLESPQGTQKELVLSQIVRAFQPNQLTLFQKAKLFVERGWEFLTKEPREANTAGGVFPAIFGTVAMTLLMTIAVMPLGILTAVYMREIAKQGVIVSFVRIAVGNLAGVPSIVYGIFGLGFFCYTLGVSIDSLFFVDKLPSPTFGTGGILWASLTLALLTVPVVIVATEEALSAVPRTLREASYGCGATRLQTLKNIILPKAAPGIMTGLILAMARGAGEVAPLLMTGVVKLAPALPVDGNFPFVHLERSFMHLGFHIYDLGFQSRSTEISRPMVFASTLLLIALVLTLNFFAIKLRTLLRKRFEGRGAF